MTTTAVFAEILAIGLQVVVWLSMIIFGLFPDLQKHITKLSNWDGLSIVLLLGAAYPLGVIADRLSDCLFHGIDTRLRKPYTTNAKPTIQDMRVSIMTRSNEVSSLLGYTRHRIRLARATAFNSTVATAVFVCLSITRDWLSMDKLLLAVALGLAIVASAVFAWARISKTYYRRLVQAYQVVIVEVKTGQQHES